MVRIPAICGGEPVFAGGPPRWPPSDPEVSKALQAAYADGSWGAYHGPHCRALADAMAADLQTPHVRLCSSGTVAVELALRGLGVEAGDEVLLAGYDFPGNFRAIAAVGALPVLVDVDASNYGLDVARIVVARSARTKAIVVSHLHGGMVDMPALMDIAREHGLAVVEDACQATGATAWGRPAGTWGDAGVFSFGGSKLLTAGRGGAIVTHSAEVHQRMKRYSEEGNDAFPLSELQAAVLLPQWRKLPEATKRRARAVELLRDALRGTNGVSPVSSAADRGTPAYYKFGILVEVGQLGGATRDDYCAAARAEGIALDPGFRGFARRGESRCRRSGELPSAARCAASLAVLHHPVLLEDAAMVSLVGRTLRELAEALAEGRFGARSLPNAD